MSCASIREVARLLREEIASVLGNLANQIRVVRCGTSIDLKKSSRSVDLGSRAGCGYQDHRVINKRKGPRNTCRGYIKRSRSSRVIKWSAGVVVHIKREPESVVDWCCQEGVARARKEKGRIKEKKSI